MAARKKRTRKEEHPGIQGLVNRMREEGVLEEGRVGYRVKGGDKLSTKLIDFVAPFCEEDMAGERYKKLIVLAVVAWNACILPEAQREELLAQSINIMAGSGGGEQQRRKDAEETFALLMRRKEQYFADDKRFIVSYQLTETDEGYYLSVASTEFRLD